MPWTKSAHKQLGKRRLSRNWRQIWSSSTACKKVNTAGTDENLFRLMLVLGHGTQVLPLQPVPGHGTQICARGHQVLAAVAVFARVSYTRARAEITFITSTMLIVTSQNEKLSQQTVVLRTKP